MRKVRVLPSISFAPTQTIAQETLMSYGQQPDDTGGYGYPPAGGYHSQGPGGYGYPPPPSGPYGYQPPLGRKTNGMAVTSLIMGIVGLLLCGFTAILGVIFGHVSLSQIKRTNEEGRGMAIAGLVLSYVGLAGWIIFAVIWLGVFAAAVSTSTNGGY
ncbi:DUF4190 domain-containing protein [Microbispora sp. H10836]|uniref:DUF4190 domain-containing protein n=1 Tax=Microbispora sp. H10836 TaxID=2729106 RepID=UPI0028936696|nr:DUF4190 domain-containing protein [Microbispora sp. H10836]